jgi:hypothetical protein
LESRAHFRVPEYDDGEGYVHSINAAFKAAAAAFLELLHTEAGLGAKLWSLKVGSASPERGLPNRDAMSYAIRRSVPCGLGGGFRAGRVDWSSDNGGLF